MTSQRGAGRRGRTEIREDGRREEERREEERRFEKWKGEERGGEKKRGEVVPENCNLKPFPPKI